MSILLFFVVLFVLVLVHEWGHFIVAKKSGIRVDEFGIGFPPKAFGKKIGETEYTFNWLPIGGFVRIWGEDPTEEHLVGPGSERSFVNKPRYIQALVLVAGVTMNIVLAFVLYTTSYLVGMPSAVIDPSDPAVQNVRLMVTAVLPNGPAEGVLNTGDEIVAVQRADRSLDTTSMASTSLVAAFIAESGEPVTLTLSRGGETVSKTAAPVTGIIASEPARYALGFSMSFVGIERTGLIDAFTRGAVRTYSAMGEIVSGFGTLLQQLVAGTANMSQVAGPVGIVGMVGDAASLGFVWLLTFSAFISLNLAVINLLPIPALDGGRLLFVAIEAVTRRRISPVIANRVNAIGFIALLTLMAVITVFDVLKLFN